MADLVCEECGSDVLTRKVDVTSFTDTARVFESVPWACSNRSCLYSNPREVSLAGFTVTRAEWEARQGGSSTAG